MAWYLDEPRSLPGDEDYLDAFNRLSSCREMGMGLGPIPWTTIMEYTDRQGFPPDFADAFARVIEAMDAGFLAWHRAEAERRRKAGG